ncbi:MAG: T9SS type A sorting domain-containing protein [Chitinophagaceae bacterium]
MKNFYSILLAFLISYTSLQAQSNLSLTYGSTQDTLLGQKGLIDAQGNTLLCSKILKTTGIGLGDKPLLALFDNNQVFKWGFFLDQNYNTASYVIEANNHDYIACWSTGISSILLRVNPQGSILWYKNFSNLHSLEGLGEDNSGNIYICGNNLNNMVVAKLDGSGNILWSKKYNANSQYFFGRGIEFDNEQNVVIMGAASYNTGSSTPNRMTLLKIKPDGQKIWSYVYGSATKSILSTGLAKSSKRERYLMVGYSGHPSNVDLLNCISVLIDSNGQYINNTELSYQYWDQYYAVASLPNGEFAITGLCKPTQVCGGNAIFVKVNEDNDTLVTKCYGESSGKGALFNDIKYSPLLGICAFGAGSLYKYWNNGSEAQCLQLDNQLQTSCHEYNQSLSKTSLPMSIVDTLSEQSFTLTSTSNYSKVNLVLQAANACTQVPLSQQTFLSDLDLKIFPNPAHENIQIQTSSGIFGKATLYDLQTRVLAENEIYPSHIHHMDISKLPTGIYILQVNHADGRQYTRKILKD